MSNLPPYSGDLTTCAACGYGAADTTYRATGECIHRTNEVLDTVAGEINPRLCRACSRCGHQWDEATVTPDPEAPPPADAKEQRS